MGWCALGPKKLRKIAAIVGPEFDVQRASIRRWSPHYQAFVRLTEKATGDRISATVNYKTGTVEIDRTEAWT